MKATRRRRRQLDPLASRAAVRGVLKDLRVALPDLIPSSEKALLALLRAVEYVERHPEVRTRRGRPSPWKDYELLKVGEFLRAILARGTKTVSLRSFIEHYLLIPGFPDEVAVAMERGDINLFEAEQLARLEPHRCGISAERLRKRRLQLLRSHLESGESGIRLKARVDALLYLYRHPEAIAGARDERGPRHAPEILEAAERLEAEIEADHDSPDDIAGAIAPDHSFYEYLQIIAAMMRELRTDEIPEPVMERIMTLSEQLIQQLNAEYKRQNPPVQAIRDAARSFNI
jgi:hypothetical protein